MTAVTTRDLGPATERIVARDLVRRGFVAFPAAVAVGALFAGANGAVSVAFALALVLANFWLSAALLAWAARISYALVMGVAFPAAVAVGALFAGANGAISVAFALALVLANFWLSAALLAWAARISYALVMGVALFGFLVRLALVGAAVYAVQDQAWVAEVPLGLALVAGHLGLLLWEARSVSASLAFPALKPGISKETA